MKFGLLPRIIAAIGLGILIGSFSPNGLFSYLLLLMDCSETFLVSQFR